MSDCEPTLITPRPVWLPMRPETPRWHAQATLVAGIVLYTLPWVVALIECF